MKFLYLLVNFFTVLVPFLFSFHPKIKFYRSWPSFFGAAILVAGVFTAWDVAFTAMEVWKFNPRYITGTYIFNLPVEEVFFFICIPFSCVFTWFCLNKFYKLEWKKQTENVFCIILSFSLFITGFIYFDRLYTSSTFISTAILLLLLQFVCKVDWLGTILTVYTFLLIPFFIVNGILTGTGLEEPVVIYNNGENLGLRLLTIPFEDIFYGLELILLNVFFFERLEKRNVRRELRAVSSER